MRAGVVLILLVGLLALPVVGQATGPGLEPVQGVGDHFVAALHRLGDALRELFIPRPPQPSAEPITGVVWRWQSTQYPDGDRIDVPTPDRYTIQFHDDGRVFVRADCNTGVGSYRHLDGRLEIGMLALTRAACPPGSLDRRFVQQLSDSVRANRDGGRLVLLLRDNSGSMTFTP